jgi:hypothetical protein
MPFVPAIQKEVPSTVTAKRALLPPMPAGVAALEGDLVEESQTPFAPQTTVVKPSAVPGAVVSCSSFVQPAKVSHAPLQQGEGRAYRRRREG